MSDSLESFLRRAIQLSIEKMQRGCGGPFGALVVHRERDIVGRGFNRVTSTNDPTAHAEIVAIRAACRKLKGFHLPDCVLYSSCEPCPMCLSAAFWARIPTIVYAATRKDAARSGFDDKLIYDEIASPKRIRMVQMLPEEAREAFRRWKNKPDKILY
jgi:tRNA(Arg) A34 adenosine deaminase TadA